MTHLAWTALGEKLYGKDRAKWKFKCVHCGHVQTPQDFINIKQEPDNVTSQCIGRHLKGVGCDWVLFGLFQIHELEVIHPEKPNVKIPTFKFVDEEQ